MDVKEFFFALAKECEEGKCEGCGAQDFCYTAPGSMTADLIERTINQMGLAEDRHKCMDCQIH